MHTLSSERLKLSVKKADEGSSPTNQTPQCYIDLLHLLHLISISCSSALAANLTLMLHLAIDQQRSASEWD
jgi:hypothetical protein